MEGRPPPERELVRRARAGDGRAFEELVRPHWETAFRLAYLITGSRAEAEDAAQEGLIKAWRALGRFRATRPFRPWFLRIVANEARNRRRSSGRRARLELRAAGESRLGGRGPVPRDARRRRRREPAPARRARRAARAGAARPRVPVPPRSLRSGDRGSARRPPRYGQVAHVACARRPERAPWVSSSAH